MSAYVLPNIILFVAIVGLLALVARHMPEAERQLSAPGGANSNSRARLWFLLQGKLRGLWRFILEAKGLRDPVANKFRMRQLLDQNQRKVRTKQIAARITAEAQVKSAPTRTKTLAPAVSATESSQVTITPGARSHTEPVAPVEAPAVAEQQVATPAAPNPKEQAEASMALAKQYLDNKQYFEARKLLESMGSYMHTSPVFWARLGYAQYHLGSYLEAVRCYEKSLLLDQGQPNRYYNLALAYGAAGNKTKSVASLDKALQLDPGNAKYLETKQAFMA